MVLRARRAKDDEGVSLLLVALCMVAILGITAIVVDLGFARQVRRQTQGGVDAAALAAARELPPNASEATKTTYADNARAVAFTYAVNDLVKGTKPTPATCASGVASCTQTLGGVTITVTTPYTLAGSTLDPFSLVRVEACQSTPTFFAGVLLQQSPRVCRSAVARYHAVGGSYDFGLVATDPTKCAALTFAGDSDTVLSSNGAVMVNSSCTSTTAGAMDSSGSSWQLVSQYIGVVGTATLAPCDPATQTNKCTQTIPTQDIAPFGDPLSYLVEPSVPSGTSQSCSGGDQTLSPGYFPALCKINNNAKVVLRPGLYYFGNGFSTNGNASITCANSDTDSSCAGVTLFIGGGELKMNGTGKVFLPPPASGPYAGVGIFQSRSDTTEATINGTADFALGTLYVPSANLKTTGSGGGNYININGMVVAKTVGISGTFNFNINVPSTVPNVPDAPDIGLEK